MINIVNDSKNQYFNLALEEYFLKIKDLNDDILILWQNEPTIVIGKNQNTYEELNTDYVTENNIKVVRRLTGGGAVYHDLGNLNFTFIKKDGSFHNNKFSFFTQPVVNCLKKFGINAVFSGRNDLLIENKKFSGNAQYLHKGKLLHHGTILFSSDLSVLTQALKVKKGKLESNGVKSVSSRVTNIFDFLKEPVSLLEFKETLISSIFEEINQEVKNYILTDEDIKEIQHLTDTKYSTWEWNFGKSPKMNYEKEIKFEIGYVNLKMDIIKGKIENFVLNGDFFESEKSVDLLKDEFIGKSYNADEIKNILKNINISVYIHGLKNEQFEELLFV